MESADPSNHSKRSLRRNSNSHISMSDTESTTSQVDSWHSPLRSESPLRSDDPSFLPENDDSGSKNSRGKDGRRGGTPAEKPVAENLDVPAKGTSPVVVGLNKFVREEQPPDVKKVEPVGGDGGGLEEGYGGGRREDEVGGERRSRAAVASILKRSERNVAVKKVALAFRVFEVIACLISFSVMAADKTQGWSGDSFDRYVEYRYCLAVNVIGFVYSGFQAFDLAYHLGTGKHVFAHHLRYHFDFTMDQASNI
ncbi:UNVERIFIED_CONTAM: CASP-like protein 4A3 [Sesamum radiatum]|uniref:CASP-like protein n=1 Tax=Sesamum radiatum TaxID=300843 RepID=A0AAW2MY25_SESRA